MSQKKYEITEITHPKYPWLHRIRARCQVNEQVGPGALGGYVQTEDNLSQDGTCWIYNQAIAVKKPWLKMTAGCLMAPWHGEAH